MKITPYKNGIHSLAKGLEALNDYFNDQNNMYFMKDAIMRVNHGLETLLKDIVFQKNPIFLLVENTDVKKALKYYKDFFNGDNDYLFDNASTITPMETIIRIRDLKIIETINEQEYQQIKDSFEKLNTLRNQLRHFAIEANPDVIVKILGNLVPRSVKLLEEFYKNFGISTNARANIVPNELLASIHPTFNDKKNIKEDLDSIFPNATQIINDLESKYDTLLNKAISKFKNSSIENLLIKFEIDDHGRIGAPPYMSRLNLAGWMKNDFEAHKNAINTSSSHYGEIAIAFYESNLNISDIEIIDEEKEWHEDVECKFNITFNSKFIIENVQSFFNIAELEDYMTFIKKPEIKSTLIMNCHTKGMYNNSHFDIREVIHLTGELKIEFISSIYGDDKDTPTIVGIQSIKLNKNNTSLRFHAFVESNKKLSNNHSLKLIIEDKEKLVFKKY